MPTPTAKTIHLPALPLDSSDILVNLIRGYIDHEVAHIRFTDFKLHKDLSELEKCIWNIIEDWRVENTLANRYEGSASNFAEGRVCLPKESFEL